MGQFKPMVKMFTDEPKVILKLKKGGKVKSSDDCGHSSMCDTNAKRMNSVFESESGKSPKKPSASARRKAMNPNQYKKGGKVAHKFDGGAMAAPAVGNAVRQALASKAIRDAAARRAMAGGAGMSPIAAARLAGAGRAPVMKKGGSASCAKVAKELKHHEAMSAKRAHGKASGGAIDAAATRTTNKNSIKPYAKTKMHDGDKHDSAGGTGKVKMGAGGYKKGGKVKKYALGDSVMAPQSPPSYNLTSPVSNPNWTPPAYNESNWWDNVPNPTEYKPGKNTKIKLGGGLKKPKLTFTHKFKKNGGTIEGNEGKFAKTKMHDGDKHDSAGGTGKVRMGVAGYHKGGASYGMGPGAQRANRAKNMQQGGIDRLNFYHPNVGRKVGWKSGGAVGKGVGRAIEGNEGKFTNNNINTGDKYDSAQGTGGVKRGAGGYRNGGRASKKAFATGGQVIDDGRAVEMPKRRISPPVANTTQAGTFKRGGKVMDMHDEGSEMNEAMPSGILDFFHKAKDLLSHGIRKPKGKGHHVIHEVVTTTIVPKHMKDRE